MLAALLCLAAASGLTRGPAGAEHEQRAPAAARTPGEPLRILGAVIDVDGVDAAAIERALALRLPGLRRHDREHGAPLADEPGLYAYIEVRRGDGEAIALRVILSDGRAYLRALEASDAEAPRVCAGALASLLPAIEEATAVPDAEDVPLPPALRGEPLPLEAMPASEAGTELAPEPQAEPEPEPEPRPIAAPVEPAPADAPPRLELGPTVGVGGIIGAGRRAAGWRGAVGHLGVDLRGRRPWIAGVDLRFGSLAVADLRLSRLRVALAGGVVLRQGAFEAPIVAILSLEPWWFGQVPTDMAPTSSEDDGPRPLLGAGLRVTPSYTAPLGERARIRLGARFEVSAAGEPRGGRLRAPLVRDAATGATRAGLGGPELTVGVDLTLWLAPRPRGRGG